MLVQRDLEIVDFINTFKVASGNQIQKVFGISRTVANRRLVEIIKTKEVGVKRIRDSFTMNYLYFIENNPTKHKLLVTEFYTKLVKQCEIIKFEKEYKLTGIQPDIFCECKYKINGYRYLMFVEVQLSNIKVDIEKYESYFMNEKWQEKFKIFPRIIVISDKDYKINSSLTIIQIDTKFNNFERVFKI
jgi:hypothetical protein